MTASTSTAPTFVPPELYAHVQQFYAWQMGLLDDGAADDWAATFTEDATFHAPARPDPLTGRQAIGAVARAGAAKATAAGVRTRFWLGMVQVRPLPDGSLRTRGYALVMRTPDGGALDVFDHVVCRDHLVPDGTSWQVRERRLTPDRTGAS